MTRPRATVTYDNTPTTTHDELDPERSTMPEGDTVWLTARRLHEALAGRELVRSDFRVPQLATTDLRGATVLEVVSRGKHLLTRLSTPEELTLHSHLRMDGSWHLYRRGARRRGGPAWQIRVELSTDDWEAVGYRLPVLELLRTADEGSVVGHLGPDLLGADWDLDEALRRLRSDERREIGPALLDQRNLAGIGNLYKCEALFVTGVSPWAPVGDVSRLPDVVEIARRMLDRNKGVPEQSTTGERAPDRQHWVYGRKGRPCRRCATPVAHAPQGEAPTERGTFWCPRCQAGGGDGSADQLD